MPYGYRFAYMIWAQILFFIITIALILWFVKNNKQNNLPKQTLHNRLASGEIDKKEYDSLLKIINSR